MTPSVSSDPLRARLQHHLDVDAAAVRQFIDGAPAATRGVLTLYYERCFQGPCVPELGWAYPWAGRELNDVLADVGRERISSAPLDFAKLTARDYGSFWAVDSQRHPATAASLNRFIESSRPLPFEREAFKVEPQDTLVFQSSQAVRVVQPVVMLVGCFTAALALVGVVAAAVQRPLPPALSVAALAALTAHGGLLFSALLALGQRAISDQPLAGRRDGRVVRRCLAISATRITELR